MKNATQIRSDLKTLRLYYASKAHFDKAFEYIPNEATKNIVRSYNAAISEAPLELYMLYYELYVNGSTQETAAEQLSYSVDFIRKKNAQLILFFQQKL